MDPAVPWVWTSMAGYRDGARGRRDQSQHCALTGHVALRVSVAGESAEPLDAARRRALEGCRGSGAGRGRCGCLDRAHVSAGDVRRRRGARGAGPCCRAHDAVFALHMRNYADRLVDAVEEALAVGRATGCGLQLSHLAVAGRRSWGSVARALERVDRARTDGLDVGVDIYPYLAGSANLSQLLPGWAQEGGSVAVTAWRDPQVRARIREEWVTTLHTGLGRDPGVLGGRRPAGSNCSGGRSRKRARQWALPADAAALELIAGPRTASRWWPSGVRGGPAVGAPRVGCDRVG